MHRQRTHFAARVNRVATAIERRGIVATYELHDRVLSNRSSRQRFNRSRPALDPVQSRVLDELRAEGFAVLPFSELVSDPEAWRAIEQQAASFVADTEAGLAAEREGGDAEGLRRRVGKEFVVRRHSYGVELGFDDPWFRVCASRRLLDLANAYLGLWSKLEYVDVWYSVPQPLEASRVASQRWHRDFNDRHLLKGFVYLTDVDEATGPFQYIAGSAPGGRYADAWPWRPLGANYPPENELEQRVPPEFRHVFTGPKGTMILCNTCGFHRGGFATGKARVLATMTYSSPASLASLTERNYRFRPASPPEPLDAETAYALS